MNRIEKEKAECRAVKELVENKSGIQDIGNRNRKHFNIEMKQLYSYICKNYTKASYETIGLILGGYDHATISHHLTEYKGKIDVGDLLYGQIFNDVKLNVERNGVHVSRQKTLDEIEQESRIRSFKMAEKYHSVINRQLKEIQNLKKTINLNQRLGS